MDSLTPYNRLKSEEPIMDYAVVNQDVTATPEVEKKRFIEDTIRKDFEPWFGGLNPKEFILKLNRQIESINNHKPSFNQKSDDEILYMVLDEILILMNIDSMINCWTYDQFMKRYKGLLVYLQDLFPIKNIQQIKSLVTTYLLQMQTYQAQSNFDFGVAFLSNNDDYQKKLIESIEFFISDNYDKLPSNVEVVVDNKNDGVQSEVTTRICNNLDKIRLLCEQYNNKAVTADGDGDNAATTGNNVGKKKVEFWINETKFAVRSRPINGNIGFLTRQVDGRRHVYEVLNDDLKTVVQQWDEILQVGDAPLPHKTKVETEEILLNTVAQNTEGLLKVMLRRDKSTADVAARAAAILTAQRIHEEGHEHDNSTGTGKNKSSSPMNNKAALHTDVTGKSRVASKNLKVGTVADAHVGDNGGRYDVDRVINNLLQRCHVQKNGSFSLDWHGLGIQAGLCFNAAPSNVSFLNGPLLVKDDEDDDNTTIADTDATVPTADDTKTTGYQPRKNSTRHQKLRHSHRDDVGDDDVDDESIQQRRDGPNRKRKIGNIIQDSQKEGETEKGKKQKTSKTLPKHVCSLMTALNRKIVLPKQQRLITDQYIDQSQTSLWQAITEITNDPKFLINLSKEERTSVNNCLVINEKLGGGMLTLKRRLQTKLLTCMDCFSTLLKKVDNDNEGGGKDLPHPLYYSSVYVEDKSVVNKICYRMVLSPVQDRTHKIKNAYDNLSAIFNRHGLGKISMNYKNAKNLADTLSRFIIVYAAWNINDNNNNRFQVATSVAGKIVSVSYVVDYNTTNNDDNNGNDPRCFTYESLLKWGRDALSFIDSVLNNISLFDFKSCYLVQLLNNPQLTMSNNTQLGEHNTLTAIADGLKFAAEHRKPKTTKTTKNTPSKITVAKLNKRLLVDMSDLQEKVKKTLVESQFCQKESDVDELMEKFDLRNVAQNFPGTSNLLNSNSTGLTDSHDANWLYHFTRLKSFLESNDYSKYPDMYDDFDLSKWVATQRFLKEQDYLSNDELNKLNEINFWWTDEDEKEEEEEEEEGEDDEEEEGEEKEEEDDKNDDDDNDIVDSDDNDDDDDVDDDGSNTTTNEGLGE